jgi:hypothetical protein
MRHWVVLILFLLALGALRMVGCGDESPCGDCSDGNPCTMDTCVSYDQVLCQVAHRCRNLPVTDGTPCGSGEICVEGVCGENLCEGVVCDDRIECTGDTCDYVDGKCVFTNLCDDNDSCTENTCDPADGMCDFTTQAEDGTPCSEEERFGICEAGACVGPCNPASDEASLCPIEGPDEFLCCPGREYCSYNCDVGAFEVQP